MLRRRPELVCDLGVVSLLVQQIGNHIGDDAINLFFVVDEMRGFVRQRGDQLAQRAISRVYARSDWIFHDALPVFGYSKPAVLSSQSGKNRSLCREIP